MQDDYNFWFWLNVMANFAQLQSYDILLKDANNDDLLNYLKHQDSDLLTKIIDQNETIINQNQKLLNLLQKGKNNA